MHGFEVGDEVKVVEAGQSCAGIVRSIQDKLKLVDVQIFQPGHMKNGLIVSFPPEQLELSDSDGTNDSDDFTGSIPQKDWERFFDHVSKTFSAVHERIVTLESRLKQLEEKKTEEKVSTPPAEDNAQSA